MRPEQRLGAHRPQGMGSSWCVSPSPGRNDTGLQGDSEITHSTDEGPGEAQGGEVTCPRSVEPSLESVILSLHSLPSCFSSTFSQDPATRRPPSTKGRSECMLSCVQLFATLWTVVHQAPLSDSTGKNTGVGCHFLLQGIFPIQGLKLHWQADSLPLCHMGSPDGRWGISNSILLGRRIPTNW